MAISSYNTESLGSSMVIDIDFDKLDNPRTRAVYEDCSFVLIYSFMLQ